MNPLRAAPLLLAMLAGCERAPRAPGDPDAAATLRQEDGGNGGSFAFSVLPETVETTPLTAAMLEGTLPPSWHVGDAWEVMLCSAQDDPMKTGPYETIRVNFRVTYPPGPGAFRGIVTVQERLGLDQQWVRQPQEVDGHNLYPPGRLEHVEPGPARVMIFDGRTFDPILPIYQDMAGLHVRYDWINDTWTTKSVLAFTPHVPHAPHRPGVGEADGRLEPARTTIKRTEDGLIFEMRYGDRFEERQVVLWRRGEPWWSFARYDSVDVDASAGLGTDMPPLKAGGRSWAVKLPPGQPNSVTCNSRR